jgi:hypothetical protein
LAPVDDFYQTPLNSSNSPYYSQNFLKLAYLSFVICHLLFVICHLSLGIGHWVMSISNFFFVPLVLFPFLYPYPLLQIPPTNRPGLKMFLPSNCDLIRRINSNALPRYPHTSIFSLTVTGASKIERKPLLP